MSVMDAVASMREVQATLQSLFPPVRSTAANPASAASFATMLAGVTATPAPTALTGVGGTASGNDVVTAALKYVGVPYVLGGEDSSGIDCSGLVQRAFADLGIEVPRLVRDQKLIGTEVPSLAEAKPGDLIVTAGGDHISIYLGNNMVVHAPYAGRDVSVQKLWVGEDGIDTIRRVLPDNSALSAGIASLAGGTTTASALAGLLGGTGGTAGSGDPSTGLSAAALQAAQAAYSRSAT
ncbi:C40 family peptidase [Lysobacter korlensis]|uniref:C40 family peptidase n=1 Tax=Lysobacter korlensis TaxID=553636 RepID=A0ABV6RVT0_9GAMM